MKRIETKYPKVTIVTLNWNTVEDTLECLDSLKKITYPNYNIVVVDNTSSGNDVQVLKEKCGNDVEVIASKKNEGYAEGNNIGIRQALKSKADYVLLLNNDTTVDPDFLTELVQAAETDENTGIVGSRIYFYNSPNLIQSAGGRIRWFWGDMENYHDREDTRRYDRVAERDFVYGTSALIKRAVIENIGLLDRTFFFGIEEYDYCTRARRAGFKVIYTPYSKVWHKVGASAAKLPEHPEVMEFIKKEQGLQQYRYYYRFFRKHVPFPLFFFPFLGSLVRVNLVRGFFQALKSRERHSIKRGISKRIFRRG